MIEMLGVLAIIGVLSAGGIMGYSVAMENYKVNKSAENIRMMLAAVESVFLKNPSYDDVVLSSAEQLRALGIEPKWMINPINNKTISAIKVGENSTGGYCFVGTYKIDGKNTNFVIPSPCFRVVFDLGIISEKICIKIMNIDWKNAGAYVFASGYLNHTSQFFTGENKSVIENICKNNASSETMHIIFYYGNKVPK